MSDKSPVPEKLYYRIGEVSQLVGVDPHVLRYWEGEFSMKPHRSSSGQRLYRKVELSQFIRIRHLVYEEGYTIQGAKRVLDGKSEGGSGISPSQLKEVLQRLEGLRTTIGDLQKEVLETGGG
jgi:DNA-binding transcriptional MerR regulator